MLFRSGVYFFTLVTYRRQGFLTQARSRALLRTVIQAVKSLHPFDINAWVLLPEHLHCICTLPSGDDGFYKRWDMIKDQFSKYAKLRLHRGRGIGLLGHKQHEDTIWQHRYWVHQIHDERDYQNHMDYIHYNPVNHGLVNRVCDWPWSTFHDFVKQGIYTDHWAGDNKIKRNKCNYGE